MSAVHAGTKKWNKIIRAAHHQHDKEQATTNTTTASSNVNDNNLMQVHFVVWCERKFMMDFLTVEFRTTAVVFLHTSQA